MTALRVVSICSGIGAFDLGLERAGMQIAAQVEIDPYCRRVLARHWPEVPRFDDLTTLDPRQLPPADVVAGGPPCQPVSAAGRGLAQEDPRWLWPAVVRLVAAVGPRWVLLENPDALLGRGLGDVLGALAEIGYDTEWHCIAAADVGAPHIRERVFILAYPAGVGLPPRTPRAGRPVRDHPRGAEPDRLGGGSGPVADPQGAGGRPGLRQAGPGGRPEGLGVAVAGDRGHVLADPDGPRQPRPAHAQAAGARQAAPGRGRELPEPVLGGVLDGAAAWLDGYRWPAPPRAGQHEWEPPRTVRPREVPDRYPRVGALGNAVVPQIVELIGRAIVAASGRTA